MDFNDCTFCIHATFQKPCSHHWFFAYFSFGMNFASCRWSASAPLFHVVSTFAHFPMKYQHVRFDIAWLCWRQGNQSTTTRWNHEAFKSARGKKMLLCVTFGAPSLGQMFRPISICSKYVTFSITFGAPVRQTILCVAFGARRRAAPARLLGGALATSDDGAGPDVRQVRVPPCFPALMSPESARIHASTPHREQFLRRRSGILLKDKLRRR